MRIDKLYRRGALGALLTSLYPKRSGRINQKRNVGVEVLEPRMLLSESASAQITLVTITGTSTTPIYHYDVSVSDTGTTKIGTFWFGWIPDEDFLPTEPSFVTSPTGWQDALTGSHNSSDGTAIEWVASSNSISPGGTLSGFDFQTTDSPGALAANSPSHPSFPATTSFVYSGAAFSDAGFQFVVTPPSTTSASTTTVSSSNQSATAGTQITLRAVVAASNGFSQTPTGSVTFAENGNPLGSVNLDANGVAQLMTSQLPVGSDQIIATYGGDSAYSGSTSSAFSQTITSPSNAVTTTTSLQSSAASSTVNQSVTFTATITPSSSGGFSPSGLVTFTDNGTNLGIGQVQSGSATFTTTSLSPGTNSIVAAYGGDSVFANSSSSPFTQNVIAASTNVPTIAKSTLPAAVVAGQVVNGVVTVDLANDTSATFKAKTTVDIFASTTGAIDSSSVELAQLSRFLVLSTTRPAALAIPVHIKAGELAAGDYMLFAQAIDPSQNQTNSAAGPALTAAAPFIALSETVVKSTLPTSAASNTKARGSVTLSILNNGNIITPSSTTIALEASASGVLDNSAVQIATVSLPLRVRPSKTARATIVLKELPQLGTGTNTIFAKVTDADGNVSSVMVGTITITA